MRLRPLIKMQDMKDYFDILSQGSAYAASVALLILYAYEAMNKSNVKSERIAYIVCGVLILIALIIVTYTML